MVTIATLSKTEQAPLDSVPSRSGTESKAAENTETQDALNSLEWRVLAYVCRHPGARATEIGVKAGVRERLLHLGFVEIRNLYTGARPAIAMLPTPAGIAFASKNHQAFTERNRSNGHHRSPEPKPKQETTVLHIRERERHLKLAEWLAAGRPDTEPTSPEPFFSTNGTGHPISQKQEDEMMPDEDPESEDDGYEKGENIFALEEPLPGTVEEDGKEADAPISYEMIGGDSECAHHWVLEAPNGRTSQGTCRKCGGVKDFPNSVFTPVWK